jgi:MerR family transcriptional regulator/heat shock protein HspR
MAEAQRFLDPADGGWSWSRRPPGTAGSTGAGGSDDARMQGVPGTSTAERGTARSRPGDQAGPAPSDPHEDIDGPDIDGRGPHHDLPRFVISVAAEMAELHPQTLRAYERDGLLSPYRTPGGTRRYSMRDVERLRLIRRLTQDEGLNLAGVALVLEMGERLESSRRRISELDEMVRVLGERLEQRPAANRFEIVKAPPAGLELHRSSRRTGKRSTPPVQRARPLPPPELRTVEPRA